MRCPSCGFENPEGIKFCGECGVPFKRRCPQCGFENPPQFKFCGECGTSLRGQPSPSSQRDQQTEQALQVSPRSAEQSTQEGGRRQLTVMFCDLVGSTALSAQLDPEEWREVVRSYQRVCAEVIQRFEGHIAQYLGDGLLVYFGYPRAHEDDAVRAVHTGLGIIEALHELNTHLSHPLQMRIGIHTGSVVVGAMGSEGRQEQLALGEVPNIAARVQGVAEPDCVVVSAVTQRLVAGLFDCQALGPQTLKGLSAPLALYRVVRESEAQSRFEVAVSTGLTPLVGRDLEVRLLQERWAQTKEGEGQVVLLSGEAGIGKSRLIQALKEQIMAEGATRIECRCSPYHQNSALYPIIEHLQRFLQFHREDSSPAKLDKLQQALARYRFPQADTVALLAVLLSLPQPESAPPLSLSPQKQKQKTLEALVAWLVEEAERQAVYCTWEDLHWADPSTLELLTLFLEQVPTTRLLVLLTFRPEFLPSWRPRSHLTQLTLNRLGHHHVEAMVEKLTGGKPIPREVVQQIVAKTDGVPLFVEELTKMVLESGWLRAADGHYQLTGPLPPLAIPSTLRDSLMARLDRLATTREIAQLGATVGREFSYGLLHAVSPLDEATLQQGLRQLVEAELVYQRGVPPQATYLFKHALIQDAAYQSLLKSTRQQYHHQIAQVLEERFPETKETQPELVAHHYTEAGLIEQAIPYWQQAGQKASAQSAPTEAITHLSTGLALLKTLPDSPEHLLQELSLQVALGSVTMAAKGYATPEVEQTYARARELCQQIGDSTQLFPVLRGLLAFYVNRAEFQTARDLGEQLLSLAHRQQDQAQFSEAHYLLGLVYLFLGELSSVRTHTEQGLAFYNPRQYRALGFRTVEDPAVSCHSFAAVALWLMGYPEQALRRIHQAFIVARELASPYNLAFALVFAAWLHQFRREGPQVQERAEAVIALANEQGFPFLAALGSSLRGWAVADQGQEEEGITQLRQGLAAWQAIGTVTLTPYYRALLAEAYGKRGQAEECLAGLAEALAAVDKTGERFYEAELYRLEGELTLKSKVQGPRSKIEEAEEYFERAIEIARQQQAKSLELRAVMSLSRLWQQQGKKAEAHRKLAEIYSWFTEGFETKDLQEARALLEELSSLCSTRAEQGGDDDPHRG
jgi:class 3 adenylate cyclase/predicted ATPase